MWCWVNTVIGTFLLKSTGMYLQDLSLCVKLLKISSIEDMTQEGSFVSIKVMNVLLISMVIKMETIIMQTLYKLFSVQENLLLLYSSQLWEIKVYSNTMHLSLSIGLNTDNMAKNIPLLEKFCAMNLVCKDSQRN